MGGNCRRPFCRLQDGDVRCIFALERWLAAGPERFGFGFFGTRQTAFVVADRAWKKRETCFWFSAFSIRGPPELWECGNLAGCARFPRSGGNGWKACLWLSTVSTVPSFPQLLFRITASCDLFCFVFFHRRSSALLSQLAAAGTHCRSPQRGGSGASIWQSRKSSPLARRMRSAYCVSLAPCAVFSMSSQLHPGWRITPDSRSDCNFS